MKSCAVSGLIGRCQLTLTRIPRQVSQARLESAEEAEDKGGEKVD